MGYYRGLYGGVTPVQTELARTGDILSQGLAAAGRNALDKERWGTQRALTEASLVRQAEMDKLQRPALEEKAREIEVIREKRKKPFKATELAPDIYSLAHMTTIARDGKQNIFQQIGGPLGAKLDEDENSPTHLNYIKPDGTLATHEDVEKNQKQIANIILANTDAKEAVKDQFSRYIDKASYLESKGIKPNSPEAKNLLKNINEANDWLENPEKQLKTLEIQRKALAGVEGEAFEKAVTKIDAQISDIKKQIREDKKTKEEQAFRAGESAKDRASREKEAELTREAGRQPKPREIGSTRTYEAGGEKITQEWDGFQWKTLGTAPIVHGITEDKLPARIKAKLDGLKEERKAISKALYEGEMLTPEKKKELDTRKKELDTEIDSILGGKTEPEAKPGRQVVRTGTDKKTGRKVNQYSDGSIEYADEQPAPSKETNESLKEPVEVNPRGEQRTNIKYNEKSPEGRMMSLKDIYSKLTPEQKKKATQAESSGYKLTVKDGQLYANIYGKDVLIGPGK